MGRKGGRGCETHHKRSVIGIKVGEGGGGYQFLN